MTRKNLRRTGAGANDIPQCRAGHPKLLHAKLDRSNGIRRFDRVVLSLVGVNQHGEHLDNRTSARRIVVPKALHLPERCSVIVLGANGTNLDRKSCAHGSHLVRVDAVVFGMGAEKLNEDDLRRILNCNNEAVAVSLDIKDNAIARKKRRARVALLDVRRTNPSCLLSLAKPCPQWLRGIWMLVPKFAQCSTGNHSHGESVPSSQNGNKPPPKHGRGRTLIPAVSGGRACDQQRGCFPRTDRRESPARQRCRQRRGRRGRCR